MSKGSAPRPFDVERQVFENNWDAIFGNSKRKNGDDQHDNVGKKGEEDKAVPDDSERG